MENLATPEQLLELAGKAQEERRLLTQGHRAETDSLNLLHAELLKIQAMVQQHEAQMQMQAGQINPEQEAREAALRAIL